MNKAKKKPVLLSGIQPSGNLMIGNYIGAIQNWVKLQDQYDCLYVLVDLHAITIKQDPADLMRRCYEFISLYIACGIEPGKNTIFVQSHVPAHSDLTWILNCFTTMGELTRMTQFKNKAKRHEANANVGLFDYPVLMASDILLYGTDLVPVGHDQKQHLELTRNLAQRFNNLYGDIFTVPEPYIPEFGSRVMSLQDPSVKMSKSDDNANNYIALLDSPDVIRKKLKRAVTDSGKDIRFDESKPGISNLMVICSSITGKSLDSIQEEYIGKGYAYFKRDLAEIVIEFLKPIQKRYKTIINDKATLATILRNGAKVAQNRSRYTLNKVHDALGFIPKGDSI